MNSSLIVAISLISAAPLYAQDQQSDAAKLKADAQKVVSIIKGDKAKTQVYCQINDLGDQIGEADEQKDRKKAEALAQKMNELEKQLVPSSFRWSRRLRTWIQIPRKVRRSSHYSISSTSPVRINRLFQPLQAGGSAREA